MPDMPKPGASSNDYDTATYRLGAAQVLAKAAALTDKNKQPLADALDRAQQTMARTFDIHTAEPYIKQARGMC
jgi:hypothetical protein